MRAVCMHHDVWCAASQVQHARACCCCSGHDDNSGEVLLLLVGAHLSRLCCSLASHSCCLLHTCSYVRIICSKMAACLLASIVPRPQLILETWHEPLLLTRDVLLHVCAGGLVCVTGSDEAAGGSDVFIRTVHKSRRMHAHITLCRCTCSSA